MPVYWPYSSTSTRPSLQETRNWRGLKVSAGRSAVGDNVPPKDATQNLQSSIIHHPNVGKRLSKTRQGFKTVPVLAASFGEVARLHDDWIAALSDSVAAVRSFHSCNMISISAFPSSYSLNHISIMPQRPVSSVLVSQEEDLVAGKDLQAATCLHRG
jgi:hypothetical protein